MSFDIILQWSGLADQLLFADINTIKGCGQLICN